VTDLQDAYLVRFDAGLTQILAASLVGGSQREGVYALVLDAEDNLFAAGFTTSPDFPAAMPVQPACGGSRDAFVLRWPAGAASPDFASCLGGRGSETAIALAHTDGKLLMAGTSDSSNFPVLNPVQALVGSNGKVFVAEFGGTRYQPSSITLGTPSPSSGQGAVQTFRVVATHPGGSGQVATLGLAVASGNGLANACAVRYLQQGGLVQLADASGAFVHSVRPGTADVATGTACVLFGSGTAVRTNGGSLELSASLLLLPVFAGNRQLLVFGSDAAGQTGPVAKGAWTVPAAGGAPGVISSAPPAPSGAGGIFSISVADPDGATDLRYTYVLIHKSFHTIDACLLVVDHAAKRLYLGNDKMDSWLSAGLGESRTIENSQCRAKAAKSKIAASGNLAVLSLDLEFTGGVSGAHTIWADAIDMAGNRSGYQPCGSYEVTATMPALAAGALEPAAGQGNVQVFRYSVVNKTGAGAVSESAFSISPGTTATGACTIRYLAATKVLQLADTAGAYRWTVRPGTTDMASSSVCTLFGEGSSYAISGTVLEVRAAVLLLPAFSGAKNLLQSAKSTVTMAWQPRGNWAVQSANSAPGVLRFSPRPPSGSTYSFDVLTADAQGAGDVRYTYGLINGGFTIANGCLFLADRAGQSLFLLNDSGTGWLSARFGENRTLENSACRIQAVSSSQTTVGSALRYVVDITFQPAFRGVKRTWSYALDGSQTSSAWTEAATITIP
jgi:hypothetical protein